ncbi:MAG: glycosyltransferase family 4 protein [Burkholderiales bacterium]|nr:glycosyltransferase family 4 protein [Burkholderiales bacterium]
MQVAYFINQYPKVSHSFIRREIIELENQGVEVARFSIRRDGIDIVDAGDRDELAKTIYLAEVGKLRILLMTLQTAISSPLRWIQALHCAIRMGLHSHMGLMKHVLYLVEACVLLNLLKRRGIRHVHAHFGTNPASVVLLAHKLSGLSYSFTVHGPEEFDKPEALSLGEKIRHAGFVVAISSFGRSQLFRWCDHEHWQKIKVVHCGLDAEFLQAPAMPVPDNQRLVCVGRLCEQKGQLLLIEAIRALTLDLHQVELVLAGDGPMRADIEKLTASYGLRDRVRITGWISGKQVLEEIAASRALVLPSFAEGLPVVLMEACALRRPVVTTYIAGIPELVQHGKTGWLVPAGSAGQLVDALRELLETAPEVLDSMGEQAYARVASQHDIRNECAKLKNLFQSALEGA